MDEDKLISCDHSNAWTGTPMWNGLTYCAHCCLHDYKHMDFVEDSGDGFDTCTLCWMVVGQSIAVGCNPHVNVRKVVVVARPKIKLTKCDGKPGRVKYSE